MFASQAGFTAVELDVWSVQDYIQKQGGTAKSLRTALDHMGLHCISLVGLSLVAPVSERVEIIKLADEISPQWLLCYAPAGSVLEVAAATLQEVVSQRPKGLGGWRPALEFLASPLSPICNVNIALELTRPLGIGLVVDSWHVLSERSEMGIADLELLTKEDVAYVQLADGQPLLSNNVADVSYSARHGRALPGRGSLALHEFKDRLTWLGFDGVVALEVLSEKLRTAPPEEEVAYIFHAANEFLNGDPALSNK